MGNNQGIAVRGLPELSRAFKQVDEDLYKALRLGMKDIATHVIGVAQRLMPWRTGLAKSKALTPRAGMRGAGIAFPAGGPESYADPLGYYPWLDFGGTTGRGHVARGHNGYGGSIIRPIVKGGRYLYPAIGDSKEYIADEVEDLIVRVARENQFEAR